MSLKRILLATASIALMVPCAAIAQTTTTTSTTAAPAAATPPAAAVTTATSAPAAAKSTPISNPTAPVTRGEFEALLKETLLAHPDIVMESVKKLHEQHVEETNKQMKEALAKHMDELAKDTTSPRAGNVTDSDVTIFEFFDYHCGYCKHMLPVITKVLEADKKVKVVFLDFPILSEDSVVAARASIAAYNVDKEKYFAFHTNLLKANGKFDEKGLSDIAKKAGIDWKKIKKEMDSPEITKQLDGIRAMAEDLGIRGTPAFIIGDELLPGAVPYEDIAKMIEALRKGEKAPATTNTKSTAEPAPARDPSQAAPAPAAQ